MLIFAQCARGVCRASQADGLAQGRGLAGSGIVSGGPRRVDDVKRQHDNGRRSRHGSATFKGTATPPLMSHKVMFVLPGECVCLAMCAAESIQRVSSSPCTCARLTDSEQTLSVRGAASRLNRRGRCSYQVLQLLLLTPPLPPYSQNGTPSV